MFNVENIYNDYSKVRFLCDCECSSDKEAKYLEASFLLPVREYWRLADLYVKGNILVLDTPDFEKTYTIATMLNNAINSKR